MASKVVVAGVSSLYMAVSVEDFPVPYTPLRFPDWARVDVAGSAHHIAATLRALGDDIRLCTLVGRDPAGEAIRAALRRRGLMGPGVIASQESSLGMVLVAPDGRRRGHPYLAAVNTVEYPVENFRGQLSDADLAVLTNAEFVRPLIQPACEAGVPIAVDVHLIADIDDDYNRPWLECADVIFCSHERLPCPPSEWISQVFTRYPGCAIAAVGRGERGCLMGLGDGTLVEVAAVTPRRVINTSGAGDALFASFLHGWLATGNPVTALEDAVLHAGWKIGHAMPGAVSLTEEELGRLRTGRPATTTLGRWDAAVSANKSP